MKILHINFSDVGGGAAQAVLRFHKILLDHNIDSKLLVCEKKTDLESVLEPNNKLEKLAIKLKKPISRNLKYIFHTMNKNTHSINLIPSGMHKKINNIKPDYVNLHWIGNETISIKEISKIKAPIVFTLHDMWAFCGAEHYTFDKRYVEGYSKVNRPNYEKRLDLNRYVWNQKIKYFKKVDKIICTTEWMFKKASESYLFKDKKIAKIPLLIDKKFWSPADYKISKKSLGLDENKLTICFGAENFVKNKRKGFNYFKEAIEKISDKKPFQIILFGSDENINIINSSVKIINLGKINDEEIIRKIFSASDIVVMPSTIEAFGQVVYEALHCGAPCVIFENTAMVDLIKHKSNGFICENSPDGLKNGIEWCIDNNENFIREKISTNIKNVYDGNKILNKYLSFLSI